MREMEPRQSALPDRAVVSLIVRPFARVLAEDACGVNHTSEVSLMAKQESMSAASLDVPVAATNDRRWRAILTGTLVAGTLDICAAIISWWVRGVAPPRVLQGVASGLLGRESFEGGAATAALGLFLHYAIMSVIVTLFVMAALRSARLTPASLPRAMGIGLLYGIVVYLVMTYVVVPLSASPAGLPGLRGFVEGIVIQIVCVGLPIALVTRRVLRGA